LAKNEYVLRDDKVSQCTFAVLNMQSLRHWNDRQMSHTHMPKPVYEVGVVEQSSTHRQRSCSK